MSSWAERRREADEARRTQVEQRVRESNETLRAIADVVLQLRASSERLEDVLEDLHEIPLPIDQAEAPLPDEETMDRVRTKLDRLINALEEERRRL